MISVLLNLRRLNFVVVSVGSMQCEAKDGDVMRSANERRPSRGLSRVRAGADDSLRKRVRNLTGEGSGGRQSCSFGRGLEGRAVAAGRGREGVGRWLGLGRSAGGGEEEDEQGMVGGERRFRRSFLIQRLQAKVTDAKKIRCGMNRHSHMILVF